MFVWHMHKNNNNSNNDNQLLRQRQLLCVADSKNLEMLLFGAHTHTQKDQARNPFNSNRKFLLENVFEPDWCNRSGEKLRNSQQTQKKNQLSKYWQEKLIGVDDAENAAWQFNGWIVYNAPIVLLSPSSPLLLLSTPYRYLPMTPASRLYLHSHYVEHFEAQQTSTLSYLLSLMWLLSSVRIGKLIENIVQSACFQLAINNVIAKQFSSDGNERRFVLLWKCLRWRLFRRLYRLFQPLRGSRSSIHWS